MMCPRNRANSNSIADIQTLVFELDRFCAIKPWQTAEIGQKRSSLSCRSTLSTFELSALHGQDCLALEGTMPALVPEAPDSLAGQGPLGGRVGRAAST